MIRCKTQVSLGSSKVAQSHFINKFINIPESQKDDVTVKTTAPDIERLKVPEKQYQVYHGEINLLSIIDLNKDVRCCKYTEDQLEVAAGLADGVIRLFDCKKGNRTHILVDKECRAYPGAVTSIKHRPVSAEQPFTNLMLASYMNGCIKCWKYKQSKCVYTIREKRPISGLTYHPQYPKFITYGDDATLNMYDEVTQNLERTFFYSGRQKIVDGHTSRIFACVFNPRSNHELISGGWDTKVSFWDTRQEHPIRYLYGVHIAGEGLDFDKTGKQILTCSWRDKDSIQIWDCGSGKLIDTVVPDSTMSRLYCGKLVPQTNLMVCGGSDANMLRVVDVSLKVTEAYIRNNPGGVHTFDFGPVRLKPRKEAKKFERASELQSVPCVAFVTANRLQTVDFG